MPGKGCCTNQPVADLLSCYTSFVASAVLLVKANTQYVEFPKHSHTAGSNFQNTSYLTFSAHLLLVHTYFSAHLLLVHTSADCIHTDRTTTYSNYHTCVCHIFPKVEASIVGQWEDNDLNLTTKVTYLTNVSVGNTVMMVWTRYLRVLKHYTTLIQTLRGSIS